MSTDAQDIAVARQLRQAGIATPEQIAQGIALQGKALEKGETISLAEALVRAGVITPTIRDNLEKQLKSQQGKVLQLLDYRLIKKLGEGGMGAVYLAEDGRDRRKVALKVLPRKNAADNEFVKRFRREVEAATKLSHPNIVRAFEAGEDLGYHFYAMEYCEGEPLDKALKRQGPFPWKQALGFVLQAARGLEYAHERGFIHRDIKPANLFVTTDGTAKILDLGLAKKIDESQLSFRTVTGAVLGTPHYISPEQARGDKEIDGRADVYSLGATLYQLLTGEVPFSGTTLYEILSKHVNAELPNPQDIVEDVPEGVVHILRRMMAKGKGDRYGGCGELVRDLEEVLAGREPKSTVLNPGASSVAMVRKPRGAVPRRRAGTYRVQSEEAPRKKPPWMWIPVAAAAFVIAGLVVLLATRGSKPEGERGVAKAPKEERTPPSDREGKATQSLEEALRFEGLREDDLEGRIRRLEGFVEKHPETFAAAKASARLMELRSRRSAPPAVVPEASEIVGNPVRWKDAIDLLPLIDPGKDGVEGDWRIENGELVSKGSKFSRIEIPYRPPEAYAFRIRFTRRQVMSDVNQILSRSGRSFAWQMGAYGNKVFGFAQVKGANADSNPTGIRVESCLESGRVHTSVVEVRPDEVKAWLDGRLISVLKADHEITEAGSWKLRDETLLGLGTQWGVTVFHRVEVLELSGRGAFTRPGGPAAKEEPGKRAETPPGTWPSWDGKESISAYAARAGVSPTEELDLGGGARMEFVLIPAGTFTMGGTQGSNAEWDGDERPRHRVTLTTGFYMGKVEVTRGQFSAFAGASGYRTEAEREGKATARKPDGRWEDVAGAHWREAPSLGQTDAHPVTYVSWNDAKAFCGWLSGRTGRKARLPTEAEWERACRAGTDTKWWFGDDRSAAGGHLWWNGNSGWKTHPVGEKRPNPWGLYDLYGNVVEWCQDWLGPYGGDVVDPAGPAAGTYRCLRGGNWDANIAHCGSSFRTGRIPSLASPLNGFRVLAEPPAPR